MRPSKQWIEKQHSEVKGKTLRRKRNKIAAKSRRINRKKR